MARMRTGTHTSVTDIHFDGIRVGDTVRDASGRTYSVDGYGRAVPDEGGSAVPLREIDRPEIIATAELASVPPLKEEGGRVVPAGIGSPPTKKPRRRPEPKPDAVPDPVPAPAAAQAPEPQGPPDLSGAGDAELAAELRRRGWEVQAVKRL